MKRSLQHNGIGQNGAKPFSLLYRIRPEGRIFCSPEQSKLCFELLEILPAAQNNLPLQGAWKTPPKSGFYVVFKMDR